MSTVTRLKVVPTAERSAASQAALVSGASVVMTASIVAMLGAIMPLPFAMPPTVYVRPSTTTSAAASLATVSVVMMAFAASGPPSADSPSHRRGQGSEQPVDRQRHADDARR